MVTRLPPLTPGRLFYLLYHLPKAELTKSARGGGPREQWRDWRGWRAMQAAAARLPPVPNFEGPPLFVHQVTGRRYLAQSLFCLWTLSHASRRNIVPVFYDDGSFHPRITDRLLEVFPAAQIVIDGEIRARVERFLPLHRFPSLRERFENYSHLRKLIAPHLDHRGWKLVLDADLLFFRRPVLILDWLDRPELPLHLQDVRDSYGYSRQLLEKLAGGSLPPCVNVGLCGLRSELIDWDLLEWYCSRLLRAEGSNYLLEQALTALLLRGTSCVVAPKQDYLTLPNRNEALAPTAVMQHYVAGSKRWYQRHSWRITCEQFYAPRG